MKMKQMDAKDKVEQFLNTLEEQLEDKDLSIPQFAKQMEVPKMTVYKWIRRESIMSLEKYYRALKVLGIEEKYEIK